MRVLDPKPHSEVDWVGKAVNLKGDSWLKQAPDWWQNTQAARDQIAKEWDETYGTQFAQNQIPFQGVEQNMPAGGTYSSHGTKNSGYGDGFSYYWDRAMPVGSSLDSKARTLAEYAKADDMSEDEYEDWLDDHKKDTRLSNEAFKRFKKKTLHKLHRLSKVAAEGRIPSFVHPGTQEVHHGMPGQSLMEHARLETGLSTEEIWRMLADEHVRKT